MKYLFYLLILINIVFLMWATGIGREQSRVDAALDELAVPGGREKLVLTKELPSANRKANAPEPSSDVSAADGTAAPGEIPLPMPAAQTATADAHEDPAAPEVTCFDIGPFETADGAEELARLIKPKTEKVAVSMRTTGVPDGWWVIFPKAESPEAAKENRKKLQDRGVHDVWIFENGELAGAISMGLHKTREEAETAQAQFGQQNIVTEVAPRLVRAQAHWIRVPWFRSPQDLTEFLMTLQDSGPEGKDKKPPGIVPCD